MAIPAGPPVPWRREGAEAWLPRFHPPPRRVRPKKRRKCNSRAALAYDMRINDPIWETPTVTVLPSSLDPPTPQASFQGSAPARLALWRMFTTPGLRQTFLILTVFWIY